MNDQIVVTHDLTKKYKKHTSVDGLNLRIRRGEIYGFSDRMVLVKQQPSECY